MSPARSGCSEFPNDNPALHDGAVWICRAPCGPARAVVRAARPAPEALWESEPASGETPPEAPREAVATQRAPATNETPEAAPADAFAELVQAISRAALGRGATRAAAAAAILFFDARLDDAALDAAARAALVTRGVAALQGERLSAAPAFVATLQAWRRVLSGASDDLSECGARTLDEWAARVLGALIGAPESQERELRRELRRQGVAAFGMMAQAA